MADHAYRPCKICGSIPELVSLPGTLCYVYCPCCGVAGEETTSDSMAVLKWNKANL